MKKNYLKVNQNKIYVLEFNLNFKESISIIIFIFTITMAEDFEDLNDSYSFESHSLVLQMDPDYQKMVRALIRLESQRIQAVKDLERIQLVREEGLKDPLGFVNSLLNGDKYKDLPGPQKIEPIPSIDMEKYNISDLIQGIRPKTRTKRKCPDSNEIFTEDDRENFITNDKDKVFIRGREYTEDKPLTFNQPWTEEEQRRLDQLLIKYPDERIASQRYLKISKELGSRTPMQVQSRVQKYFVALKREGLPIPGKPPSSALVRKAGRRRIYNNMSSFEANRPSSFMQAFNYHKDSMPFHSDYSNETSEINSTSKESIPQGLIEISDEEDIAPELRSSEEYKEMMRLKQVKQMKKSEQITGQVKHPGFCCDSCKIEPILGTRWHCTECPETTSIDFCSNCVKNDYSSHTHKTTHVLKPIEKLCMKDTINWLRDINY